MFKCRQFCVPKQTTKQINKQQCIQIQIEKQKAKEISNFEFINILSLKSPTYNIN